jgi:large subunit ribosomal protein L14
MIQLNTHLSIIDNSGAKIAKCIKILGGSYKGCIGNTIVIAIQKAAAGRKIKSGEVYRSLVVRQKKEMSRIDGSTLSFFENSSIILNNKNIPMGTRIFGPIPKEFRKKRFMKVLSIAQGVV